MQVYWLPVLGLAGIVALLPQDPWIGSPALRSSTLQRRCQRVQRETPRCLDEKTRRFV